MFRLTMAFLLIFHWGNAQDEYVFLSKLAPGLASTGRVFDTHEIRSFVISVSSSTSFQRSVANTPGINTKLIYEPSNIFQVWCSYSTLTNRILPLPEVLFADLLKTPREEVAVSNLDLGVNKVNVLHRRFPNFNGTGLGISIKEQRPDTADIDFRGRYHPSSLESAQLSAHATIITTIAAGGGNTYYEGKGVAFGSEISSVSFTNLFPETDSYYQQHSITVQNHSYGTGIEYYYGADAMAYDQSSMIRASLQHVFSAGNAGLSAGSSGTYSGISGYANITGSFKMAKNVITVGHTDSTGIVLAPSSKGPGYDGRLLPGLVAFGEDGSSGAAAIVSGIAMALQDAYQQVYGILPPSSLVRAILYNSTDDAGSPGIDFNSGYGAVNASEAFKLFLNASFFNSSVSHGGQQVHPIVVGPMIKKVRVTLTWNDPAAAANAPVSLINDLDLELVETATNNIWLPWVLSHYPHPDSLAKLPVRKRDGLNNAEQVSIELPAPGNYEIIVKGFNIPGLNPQSYSITYSFDTLNSFEWLYPTSADNIFSGRVNMLRWKSNFPFVDSIRVTYDNGSSWQLIGNSADIQNGFFRWNAPDTFVTAQVAMYSGIQSFSSERFTISKRFDLNVGFDCPDSFSFHWQRIPNANEYRVFRLGNKYMEPFLQTTDSFFVLPKSSNPSMHYAVAPMIGSIQGVRSYAYDYSTQGVGCYIRTFFANLSGQNGLLHLELGTSYGVQSITWEKLTTAGFIALDSITGVSGIIHQYTDMNLLTGLNIYRVRIRLLNGQVIYSSQESIHYFGKGSYIVYPNPARADDVIRLLNNETDLVDMKIFNAAGMEIYRRSLDSPVIELPAGLFRAGLYILHFIRKDGSMESLKLVVQ